MIVVLWGEDKFTAGFFLPWRLLLGGLAFAFGVFGGGWWFLGCLRLGVLGNCCVGAAAGHEIHAYHLGLAGFDGVGEFLEAEGVLRSLGVCPSSSAAAGHLFVAIRGGDCFVNGLVDGEWELAAFGGAAVADGAGVEEEEQGGFVVDLEELLMDGELVGLGAGGGA